MWDRYWKRKIKNMFIIQSQHRNSNLEKIKKVKTQNISELTELSQQFKLLKNQPTQIVLQILQNSKRNLNIQNEMFLIYPLGKLYPNVFQLAHLLEIDSKNLILNWENAINNDDLEAMLAIATIVNKQKEKEQQPFQKSITPFKKIRHNRWIIETFFKLTKNNTDCNKKVSMILVCLISHFYCKFPRIQQFLTFNKCLTHIIQFSFKMMEMIGKQEKQQMSQLMQQSEEVRGLKQGLKIWMNFLEQFDGNGESLPNQEDKKVVEGLIEQLILQFGENKFIDVFLSSILYVKLDFLIFFEKFNEDQYDAHRKKIESQFSIRPTWNKQEIMPRIQDSPSYYINVLLRTTSQYVRKHRILYCILSPVLHFLPRLLLRYKSQEEKQFLEKILLKILKLLKQISSEENTHNKNINQTKINNARDMFRAFNSTSLLNDLQVVLVGFYEQHLKDTKIIHNDGTLIYKHIYEPFELISQIKLKVIQSIDLILNRLTQQWQGATIFIEKNIKLDKEQHKIGQLKRKQEEKMIKSKKKDSVSLSIQKNSKKNGRSNKTYQMEQIFESNEEDENIIEQDLSQVMVSICNEEQQDTDEGFNVQKIGQDESLNLVPLEKNRKNASKLTKNHHEFQIIQESKKRSLQLKLKPTCSAQQRSQSLPKNVQRMQGVQKPSSMSIFNIKFINDKPLITYYQHHYKSLQIKEVFGKPVILYLQNRNQKDHAQYSGSRPIIYPSFINQKLEQNRKYSILKNKQMSIPIRSLSKYVPQRCEQSEILRKKLLAVQFEIQKAKNCPKKKKPSQIIEFTNKMSQLQQKLCALQNDLTLTSLKLSQNVQSENSIEINIFPLTKTKVGFETTQALTQCLQLYMKYFTSKYKINNQSSQNNKWIFSKKQLTNPFNSKFLLLQNPYQILTLMQKPEQLINYFLSLVFDVVCSLQNQCESQEKNNQLLLNFYFHHLDTSQQSILLFYIYELERNKFLDFEKCVELFLDKLIQNQQDFIKILRFYIKEIKLTNKEFCYLYKKLNQKLNRKVSEFLHEVVYQLLQMDKTLNQIKKETQNNSENSQFIIRKFKEKLQILEKHKFNYYQNLCHLIDTFHFWLILASSNPKIEKSNRTFYCPICTSMELRQCPPGENWNYQDPFCSTCTNGLLNQFELSFSDSQFVLQCNQMRLKLCNIVSAMIKTINYDLEQNHSYNFSKSSQNKSQEQQNYIRFDNRAIERVITGQQGNIQNLSQLSFEERVRRLHQLQKKQQSTTLSNKKQASIPRGVLVNNSEKYQSGDKRNHLRSNHHIQIQSHNSRMQQGRSNQDKRLFIESNRNRPKNGYQSEEIKQRRQLQGKILKNESFYVNSLQIIKFYLRYIINYIK